jgi:hypothetical protein
MDSSVCGYRGEALFDQRLIPFGFARSFAAGRGQEIAKVGSMCVIDVSPDTNTLLFIGSLPSFDLQPACTSQFELSA